MVLWKVALIVLGSIVAGLLVGTLLIYVFQKIRKRQWPLFQKKPNITKTETPSILTGGIIKSNGRNGQAGDTLELLIQNHKNNASVLNQTQSSKPDVLRVSEILNQKNTTIMGEQKQPPKPSAPREPVTADRKNLLVAEENEKAPGLNAPGEPEIINQKSIPLAVKQNKSSKSEALKEPDIVRQKNAPIVKEQKKTSKPSTPREPVTVDRKNTLVAGKNNKSPEPDVLRKSEIIEQRNAPVMKEEEKHPGSDFFKELETNLAIASTPWADKLLPFQTSFWDSRHGEGEPLVASHHQELIQLYVDIGLANNIVWLSTEIGHRSKDLDESYIKLCGGIAERLKRLMSLLSD